MLPPAAILRLEGKSRFLFRGPQSPADGCEIKDSDPRSPSAPPSPSSTGPRSQRSNTRGPSSPRSITSNTPPSTTSSSPSRWPMWPCSGVGACSWPTTRRGRWAGMASWIRLRVSSIRSGNSRSSGWRRPWRWISGKRHIDRACNASSCSLKPYHPTKGFRSPYWMYLWYCKRCHVANCTPSCLQSSNV